MATLTELFQNIADSIRNNSSITGEITALNFPSAIDSMTSDADATASSILNGKTAYVNGEKITGTIPSVEASTITPGTSNKTAISAGSYASGTITVAGDADLKANNIVQNKNIFGVTGNTWAGTLSFTGSYTGSTYLNQSESKLIVDKGTGYGILMLRKGSSTSYTLSFATQSNHTVKSGQTILYQSATSMWGGSSGNYIVMVFSGITSQLKASVATARASSGSGSSIQCTVTFS